MARKNTNNKIFENDTFIAIPTSLLKASHMQYVNKTGEHITVPVCSDFKILYGFLSDQFRSFEKQTGFDGEGQEFYQDWDMIFRIIGRKYTGDKNSLKLVKLLEDCGLLVQTKRPNSTSTNKYVFDVSAVKSIVFSNPERDKWEQEQHQRRADRKAAYAEAKAEKLAAIEAAKQQHNQTVKPSESVVSKPEELKTPPEPPKQNPEQNKQEQPRTTKPVVKYGTQFEQLKSQGYVMNDNRWVDLSQDQQREIAKAVNACNSLHEAANKFMELVDEYTNLLWDDVPF